MKEKFEKAKTKAIDLQREAEETQSKAEKLGKEAEEARAEAKKLKKSLGQDDEDDGDDEFGVTKKIAGKAKKAGSKGPTGVSVV